jgi:hypothetical protein
LAGSSPLVGRQVAAGSRKIELQRLGYIDHTRVVEVVAGRASNVTAKLTPDPKCTPPTTVDSKGVRRIKPGCGF